MLIATFCSAGISRAVSAAAIAQSFRTVDDANIVPGALVSLKDDSPNIVDLSNQDRADKLIGVVSNNPLVELSEGGSSVQVVISGVTSTLVSDINGDVKTGDKITASPIEGVGMKATQSSVIVGTAQADISTAKTSAHSVTDKQGNEQTVQVGLIPMQVNVTFYASPNDRSTFLPAFLQDFANGVAGKDVSPVRVLIAATILLLAFVSIAVLLYASVKSSIISIGRNPLSEISVRKSLFQIGGVAVAILLLTLITIYLILTT